MGSRENKKRLGYFASLTTNTNGNNTTKALMESHINRIDPNCTMFKEKDVVPGVPRSRVWKLRMSPK